MGEPADEHRRIAGCLHDDRRERRPGSVGQPGAARGLGRPRRRAPPRRVVPRVPRRGRPASRCPPGPSVDDDPGGAWRTQTDAVQALLDDPATAERVHDLPHIGTMPLGQAIDMIYTSDVFMHRWDLARATGQDETLDPDKCAEMLAGMLPMDEVLRQSGQYGPRVDVPDDADVQTKLLAFIGRTP